MIKGIIKANKMTNQAYLVLIAISFLIILIGGSCQSVWGKELAPMPTQAVKLIPKPRKPIITKTVSPKPSITKAINPQERSSGKVVPVNMSQLFAIMVVGMTSLKLICREWS